MQAVQLKVTAQHPKPPSSSYAYPKKGAGKFAVPPKPSGEAANALSWGSDSFLVAVLDKVDKQATALKSYIKTTNQACTAAIAADKGALRELDTTTYGMLKVYQLEVDAIADIHIDVRKTLRDLKGVADAQITLQVEELKDISDDAKAKAKAAIDDVKARRKTLVSQLTDLSGATTKLAIGKPEGAVIDMGKVVIKTIGNAVVDYQLADDYKKAIDDISKKYDALVSKLKPNTKLDNINVLKERLKNIRAKAVSLRTHVNEKIELKNKKVAQLKDHISSILGQESKLTSLPLIQKFYAEASNKGAEQSSLIEGLVNLLAIAPDFEAAKHWFIKDRQEIAKKISEGNEVALGYTSKFEAGAGFAVPQKHKWMFNPAYLTWYESFLYAYHGKKPDYGKYAAKFPPPSMYSDDYKTRDAEWLAENQKYIDWAGKYATWLTNQQTALQTELAFVSGPHIKPAHTLLEAVISQLRPNSNGAVKPAKKH